MQETPAFSSNTAVSKPITSKIHYLLVIVLGLGTICAFSIAALMQATPTINVEGGSNYQAGVIASRRLSHDFVIFNPHPYSIAIEANSEGCTCTTTRLDQRTLGAFSHMPVHISIDSEGNGQQTEGTKITTSHAGQTAQAWLFVNFDADLRHRTDERKTK